MKVLFWNCRGLGRPATQHHLKNQIQSHGPDVVLLSETFAQEKTASRAAHRVGFHSFYVQPPEGRRNGFLVLWNQNVSISVLFSTNWLLEMQFYFRGRTCYMLFIHADSRLEVQEQQWELIEFLCRNYEIPWLILGDFNAMLQSDEKRGGLPLNRRQVESFHPLLQDLLREPRERHRPFRFKAIWLQEESCASIIAAFWQNQNIDRSLSCKLQGFAWELKRWSRSTVGNIHDKLQQINEQLIAVQEELSSSSDIQLAAKEKLLQHEYNKLLAQ